jgi:hypothetical protein
MRPIQRLGALRRLEVVQPVETSWAHRTAVVGASGEVGLTAWSWTDALARVSIALVVAIGLAACSDATAPPDLGPLLFGVTVGCAPSPNPPYVCTGPTSYARGDTMTLGTLLIDTTAFHDEAQVIVRPICWQNLEIRRGGTVVDYFPRVSTCPDSTLAQGENAPGVFVLRFFRFIVPDAWTPGTYTARSLILVDPPAMVSRAFTIR